MVEQQDGAAVGRKLAGDQVEQRGRAGAVGPDDEPPFAGLDRQADIGGDAQAPERLAQGVDLEGTHDGGSGTLRSTLALPRSRNARHPMRHRRTEPGTTPSGIQAMMETTVTPTPQVPRSTSTHTKVFL